MIRSSIILLFAAALLFSLNSPCIAQPGDSHKAGWPFQLKSRFWSHEPTEGPPYTLLEIGQMLDILEEAILDDGTIVIKQPDLWGQNRMTKFRREFENEMFSDLSRFKGVISARIARSDQASFENVTAVSSSLSGQTRAPFLGSSINIKPDSAVNKDAIAGLTAQNQAAMDLLAKQTAERDAFLTAALGMIAKGDDTTISRKQPFGNLPGGAPFSNISSTLDDGKLGLEPTVLLDEKKRYLDHLHELRRVNLGDDNADRAGYSLYLVRMPVSIQPGDKSVRGHGAVLSVNARPDFGVTFLQDTYRNLVVTDLVDLLSPVIYEMVARNTDQAIQDNVKKAAEMRKVNEEAQQQLKILSQLGANQVLIPPSPGATIISPKDVQDALESSRKALAELKDSLNGLSKGTSIAINYSRIDKRPYPVAPTDVGQVFFIENLATLAQSVRTAVTVSPVRALDVRAYLEQELSDAYDVVSRMESLPIHAETIAASIESRNLTALSQQYKEFVDNLPGDLKGKRDDPTAILAWATIVDAGLLNRRIKEEMIRLTGQRGFQPTCDLASALFYLPCPDPLAQESFIAFVKARWPIITFAVDPVVDQQNIADAFSQRREMQVALAVAFAGGRLNFNQFDRFRRRLEFDAETIALNRTVTSFAHGNESFGWRFMPRFQTPPQESNLKALGNLVFHGGPTVNSRLKASQLEAGQRELTVIMLMPSFLQRVRFDVAGNWFKLTNRDDQLISTSRMIWLGHRLTTLREATICFYDQPGYRAGDVERVLTRIDQLEASLPMQTEFVQVPYENMQSGFELFSPGGASLAPELFGYTGLGTIEQPKDPDKAKDVSLLLYGKNMSIQQTEVIAGGRFLPQTSIEYLSRQTLRIVIPGDLLTSLNHENQKTVEVHVATSNGISNRLLIPYKATESPAPQPPLPAISHVAWDAPPSLSFDVSFDESQTLQQRITYTTSSDTMTISTDDFRQFDVPREITKLAMRITPKGQRNPPTWKTKVISLGNTGQIPLGIGKVSIETEQIAAAIGNALYDKDGLSASQFAVDKNSIDADVETYVLFEGAKTPVKLDNSFSITVKRLPPAPKPQ